VLIIGLDNGIIVKSTKRSITRDILPAAIIYPSDEDYNNEVEILYWRKNWGIRTDVITTFSDSDGSEYRYEINKPEDVMKFIELIASWLNKDRWETEGRSIWTYEEIRPILIQNIINLSIIYTFMCENPDIYLVFYDSY
jgi:hypothetical protein